ncbi:MAG: cobalt-precorrin 5A hydrolase [Andreesenia angusta]|nr:cobalt-precorrin 5A hydrolase [Andreesenia angusta]
MRLAIISFTSAGKKIAEDIKKCFENIGINSDLKNKETVNGKISDNMEEIFKSYDGLIFISSTGIAIRLIAPYIDSKLTDPAVIVIDDLGRYTISLLSGHIGGANRLCETVSEMIGSKSIITTASDGRNIDAVDIFAIRNQYEIESMEDAKKLTQLMVEGKNIAIISDESEDLNYDNKFFMNTSDMNYDFFIDNNIEGIIAISSYMNIKDKLSIHIPYKLKENICVLIPKELYIGIGCRRNTSVYQIRDFVSEIFERNNLSLRAVKAIGSIDIKEDEFGIIELAEFLNAEYRVFSKEALLEFEDLFPGSEFVKKTVGVSSVSQTAAYKMSRNIIVDIEKREGMTVTIGRKI